MATAGENALLIAINSLAVMLDAKGTLTRQEFIAALRLEQEGRPPEVVAVLDEMARQIAPKPRPTLTAIAGGKPDDPST